MRPKVNHRFHGKNVTNLYFGTQTGLPIVGNLGIFVHTPPNSMANVITNYGIALSLRVLLDSGANVAQVMNVIGDVEGRNCLVVDDIIDTAGTLVKTVEALKDKGAVKVYACATHPVLSGPAVERIEKSMLEEVIVTNTIPLSVEKRKCKKIRMLSVAKLLGEAVQAIHDETSVSGLFI